MDFNLYDLILFYVPEILFDTTHLTEPINWTTNQHEHATLGVSKKNNANKCH